jgi:hypothetical protein
MFTENCLHRSDTIFSPHVECKGNQIREDEMDGACATTGNTNSYRDIVGNLKEGDYKEDLGQMTG